MVVNYYERMKGSPLRESRTPSPEYRQDAYQNRIANYSTFAESVNNAGYNHVGHFREEGRGRIISETHHDLKRHDDDYQRFIQDSEFKEEQDR